MLKHGIWPQKAPELGEAKSPEKDEIGKKASNWQNDDTSSFTLRS